MIFTRNNYCQDIPFDWFAKSHRIKKPSILNLTKIEIRGDCLLTHGARACFPCCQVRLECNPPWLTEKRRGEIREGKRGGLTDSPLSHIKTIRLFRPFPTCSPSMLDLFINSLQSWVRIRQSSATTHTKPSSASVANTTRTVSFQEENLLHFPLFHTLLRIMQGREGKGRARRQKKVSSFS